MSVLGEDGEAVGSQELRYGLRVTSDRNASPPALDR
jgi:hypothetical protein